MQFTQNEIATYLFCAKLAQTKTIPLTVLEWNAVVKSLSKHQLEPEALLTMTSDDLLNILTEATAAQRIRILSKIENRLKLGISLLEMEEIIGKGYGIIFRSHMPSRLKKLTQKFIPAFFYSIGDLSILSHPALGVVGARDASKEELDQTAGIAKEAALANIVIISGGARGVDTTAVDSALQHGGKAIILPADGLEKWVKKSETRQYVANRQLLLLSTQQLNARFTPAYAMQRNKFIHAPADAVLVASSQVSGQKKSGTWEGVQENLKFNWSPIYGIGESAGVSKLLDEGNATRFSTIQAVFTEVNQQKNVDSFTLRAKQLVQFAAHAGIEQKSIEKNLANIVAQYFNEKSSKSQENPELTSEVEQLSFETVIKEKSNNAEQA